MYFGHVAKQAGILTINASRCSPRATQVVGAISLGALITGDIESAKSYHLSLRHHLGDLRNLTGAAAVPSLALAALYWQHQGEDELKAKWVEYARRALFNVQVRGMFSGGGSRDCWRCAVVVRGVVYLPTGFQFFVLVRLDIELDGNAAEDPKVSDFLPGHYHNVTSPAIDSRVGR